MKLDQRNIDRWTEADVVMELCHQLKLQGFVVRCEVTLPSSIHRSKFMRCDVAIVENDEIVCLFEVKDTPPPEHPIRNTRQARAYTEVSETHGVPIFFVHGMQSVEAACAAARLLRR